MILLKPMFSKNAITLSFFPTNDYKIPQNLVCLGSVVPIYFTVYLGGTKGLPSWLEVSRLT